jgi:outer membrane receptor protein involved in Fe transport
LGYQGFLTLDGSYRYDISSTLPDGDNGYGYWSASAAWLFSHHLQNVSWLSSGKLRVNVASVGNSAAWGSLLDVYDQPTSFGGSTLFSQPGTKNNPALKPERTNSKEIGLEMSFFKNRLGFDATYYMTNTVDQIIPVAVSGATGYNTKYLNAGDVENKGIELSLFANPVKTKDFSWNINLNWTRNRNEVKELFDDGSGHPVTNLQLGTFQGGVSVNATLGQPYGTIQGKTYTYLNGQKVVDASGEYIATSSTTNVIGDINPDWYGGIYNSFKYKNWNLGFLIDMKKGGDVWSLDMFYGLNYTGVYPESSGLNELGKSVRDNPASGGGVIYPA